MISCRLEKYERPGGKHKKIHDRWVLKFMEDFHEIQDRPKFPYKMFDNSRDCWNFPFIAIQI
jgi:hypothetical protein